MNGLIRFSLRNWHAVIVFALTLTVVGVLLLTRIPFDILPVYKKPAVQVLTFYGGMPASSVEKDISNRMERWTGQAAGTERQESRSITGCSIIRNYYRDDIDPNGALTQVNSLALATVPNLPPGTLPPVVLPYDPTSTVPVCIVAVDSPDGSQNESILYDVGRYEVRNMILSLPGSVAPVVYGGRIRAVMAYLDRQKLQARALSPLDVMKAMDRYNVFLPTGDAKFGDMDFALDLKEGEERLSGAGLRHFRTRVEKAAHILAELTMLGIDPRAKLTVLCAGSEDVLPFSITQVTLRAMLGTVGDMGTYVPVWDIAEAFGEDTDLAVSSIDRARDLAQRLGSYRVVLRRGVGFVTAGRTLNDAVKTSVYIPKNARTLAQSLEFGSIRPISQGEVDQRLAIDPESNAMRRGWEYWAREAGCERWL